MNTRIHKYILKKLDKETDTAVISSSKSKTNQIKFVNNKIATNKIWDDTTTSLFIVKDKKIIDTALEKYDKKSIDSVIKKALSLLKLVAPNEEFVGIAEGPFKYSSIPNIFDSEIVNLGEDSINLVKSAIDTARAHGAIRSSGVLEFGTSSELLTTSNKTEAEEKSTAITFSIRSFTNKESSGHKVCASCMLKEFDPDNSARLAAKLSEQAMKPQPIPAGKYDVIFDPLAFADILNSVAGSASMFDVEAGLSFLANKLNKNVADAAVTLYDDATLPNGLASTAFDAEGRPSQKNTIIEDGVLKTYLHNTSTAARNNTESTSNAGLIAPSETNIVLEARGSKFEDLLAEVRKGIYVTNQWYTRFQNYSTGDFSTIPRDAIFLIKDGEIKYPVKGIRISDNMVNIMRSIHAIGNDAQQISSWEASSPTTTPSVLVKNLNITRPK